ncbi:hypothetical protein LDENG_00272270 [Lucifuga dentata]|nr:hypothetical protein LDENG_00272270 [Lucifuga dentata]
MLPKTRLGKRSPLGALLSSSCTAAYMSTNQDMGQADISVAKEHPGISRVRVHPGLKVSSQCGGHGSSGSGDQVDFMQTHNSVLRRTEDVWPSSSSSSSEAQPIIRSVSSCIDVPRRRPEEVEVDEMMAAMILTSLSCSPLLHSPTHSDTTAPPTDSAGGQLSDSGSSGYWSVGCRNESPVPSPPIVESDGGSATPPDQGLDMDLEQVLFDEPSPRKRRNSVKVVFRCLWPSCEKVLTSSVGIKRHILTIHLSEKECCSRSEEDFYYTEIHQWDKNQHFWQVQSEHSYQALPPSHVISAATSWMAPPPSSHSRQVGSVSAGEQWLQQHSAPCRRIRGEAKKCRKVYGIEHREQWCTACRWKKACQRFID